ncbi:MAG: CoA transferase [SAR202 cluster bacterium]|nr:CoA transferase [SAR202 cluster bacterium]
MNGPLSGIRVLDVSRILSGPYCTMILADMGADVVKVESARGDIARRMGPLVGADAAYFQSVNRGKRGITLDIFKPEGQRLFRRLALEADVLVENYTPGTMDKLGLGQAELRAANPRLVYASISGFGQDGPYARRPALDAIVQAAGGLMSVTGLPGGEPLRPGVSLGDSLSGTFTALAICAALFQRHAVGRGQYVDISMLDCQVTLMENALARYFATGQVPGRIGSRHPVNVPFQSFATADGYIVVAMITDDLSQWKAFCDAIERPALGNDPRFKDNRSRWLHFTELEPLLAEPFTSKPSAEWLAILDAAGVPCGPINDIAQVASHPQVLHRGMVPEVPVPPHGGIRMANTPFKFSDAVTGPAGHSPLLGEHTAEVLRDWLGAGDAEIADLRAAAIV